MSRLPGCIASSMLPLLVLALPLACGAEDNGLTLEAFGEVSEPLVVIPPKGTSTTVDVGGWNMEWFGSAGLGPSDETLQLENIRDVMNGADLDIWAVQEVVSAGHFDALKAQLPGHVGFLANDPIVVDGTSFYTGGEQKLGILYKPSVVTVQSAKLILTADAYFFAGRPPLEVSMTVTASGVTTDLVLIVLHAKALTDTASYTRRKDGSASLKAYLDTTYPTTRAMVVGDFNDDVDVSISSGKPSPYKDFVDDAADYFFPTKAISDAGGRSTVSHPNVVDHHLITSEMAALYVPGSAEVYRVDHYISSYGTTTSDHFPVLARYSPGALSPGTIQVTAPNGGELLTGNNSQPITWTSSNVAQVRLDYTLDGATWIPILPSTPAGSGSYAWTVPNVTTSSARVQVSDAANIAVVDRSDAPFTITGVTQVFINEICANEPGSSLSGEFIEVVNAGGTAVNLSGWTLSDASGLRHTFPNGTTLAPHSAFVVFGGASAIPPGLGGAVAASTGGLSLNNNGDVVTLKNNTSAVVDSFTYAASLAGVDGVSMNRSPDVSLTTSFVLHTTLVAAQGSPGTRANGAAF